MIVFGSNSLWFLGDGRYCPVSPQQLARNSCTGWKTAHWASSDGNAISCVAKSGIRQGKCWENSRCIVAEAAHGSSDGVRTEPTISEAKPAGRKRNSNGARTQQNRLEHVSKGGSRDRAKAVPKGKVEFDTSAHPSREDPEAKVILSRKDAQELKNVGELVVSVAKSSRERSKTRPQTLRSLPATDDSQPLVIDVAKNEAATGSVNSSSRATPSRQKKLPLKNGTEASGGADKSSGSNDKEEEMEEDEEEEPAASSSQESAKTPAGQTTIRMIRLPGGRLVDPRTVKGWVILPDGRKIVCGRCGGRAILKRGDEVGTTVSSCSCGHADLIMLTIWRRRGGTGKRGG
jgi:hypothetical protein